MRFGRVLFKMWSCSLDDTSIKGDFDMIIKVYGEQAKQIKEGQKFIAKLDDVEGRTVVILESDE